MDDYGETEGSQPQLWPGPAGDSVRAASQHSVKAGSGVPELHSKRNQRCCRRRGRGEQSGETDRDGNGEAGPHWNLPGAVSSGFFRAINSANH